MSGLVIFLVILAVVAPFVTWALGYMKGCDDTADKQADAVWSDKATA